MTVTQLTKEDRERRLLESFKKGDVVKRNPRHAGEWLVSSSTYDRVWYRVRAKDQTCGCDGYKYRGMCRHLVRVSWEIHQLQVQARREVRFNATRETLPAMPQVAAA